MLRTENSDMGRIPKRPKLNRRLRTCLEMAGTFTTFADIGADHGYLSAVILAENPDCRGIVSDISEKALSKAERCIREQELNERALLYVADGLKALRNAAFLPQVVFILGMGGDTISRILQEDANLLHHAKLILSAHTEVELLRRKLCALDYSITDERYVLDNHRGYVLIAAEIQAREKAAYSDKDLFLGPVLQKTGGDEWYARLARRADILAMELEAMEKSGRMGDKASAYHRKKQEWIWINEALTERVQKG